MVEVDECPAGGAVCEVLMPSSNLVWRKVALSAVELLDLIEAADREPHVVEVPGPREKVFLTARGRFVRREGRWLRVVELPNA